MQFLQFWVTPFLFYTNLPFKNILANAAVDSNDVKKNDYRLSIGRYWYRRVYQSAQTPFNTPLLIILL